MLDLSNRSCKKELLDEDGIAFDDIKQNLIELNTINTLLGGHRITLLGAQELISKIEKNENIVILEIGCGGGDNLEYLQSKFKKRELNIQFIGADMKETCIEFAKNRNPLMQFICTDYRNLSLNEKPDIIFSSLFCHHFSNEELSKQMKWMQENSTLGFFINDLHRHWLAYYSIKILTSIFSKSHLVKNDAPLSVARSFRKQDWKNVFAKANIHSFNLQWKWAFRYLIVFKHD